MERKQAKCQKPRTWIRKGREKLGLAPKEFGKRVGCSEALVDLLEEGVTITHPNIAARIVHAVGGTVRHYNQLVHKMHKAKELPPAPPLKAQAGPMVRECDMCGNTFIARTHSQRFCSISCASYSAHKERKERKGKGA